MNMNRGICIMMKSHKIIKILNLLRNPRSRWKGEGSLIVLENLNISFIKEWSAERVRKQIESFKEDFIDREKNISIKRVDNLVHISKTCFTLVCPNCILRTNGANTCVCVLRDLENEIEEDPTIINDLFLYIETMIDRILLLDKINNGNK